MFIQCPICYDEVNKYMEHQGKKMCTNCYVEKYGGEGSGNFGHEGRPGEVGGSGENGASNKITDKTIDVWREKKNTQEPQYRDVELMSTDDISRFKEFDRVKTPNNTQEGRERLKESIRKNGITEAVILDVDKAGRVKVTEGNNRIEIAKELGIKVVPVRVMRSIGVTKQEQGLPIHMIDIPDSAYYDWDLKEGRKNLKATMSPSELGLKIVSKIYSLEVEEFGGEGSGNFY
uniref:Uncharacterized protein n=1 Tax=viral metagenome TaxID=1070528 RepID=A0A6M3IRB0_9ZZZZ